MKYNIVDNRFHFMFPSSLVLTNTHLSYHKHREANYWLVLL